MFPVPTVHTVGHVQKVGDTGRFCTIRNYTCGLSFSNVTGPPEDAGNVNHPQRKVSSPVSSYLSHHLDDQEGSNCTPLLLDLRTTPFQLTSMFAPNPTHDKAERFWLATHGNIPVERTRGDKAVYLADRHAFSHPSDKILKVYLQVTPEKADVLRDLDPPRLFEWLEDILSGSRCPMPARHDIEFLRPKDDIVCLFWTIVDSPSKPNVCSP